MAHNETLPYTERVEALLEEAEGLSYAPTRVALCEEAVRLADLHNDVPLGYEARMKLVQAASFAGLSEVMLIAYTWCLARYDETPTRFDEHRLLWCMKW